MRPTLVSIVFAAVVTLALPSVAGEKPKECMTDCLDAIVNTLASALKEADVAKAMSVYVDSPEVLAIQPNGAGFPGPDKIKAMYADAFKDAKFHEVKFDFVSTHLEDGFGFAYFTMRAVIETPSDGKKFEQYVQGTWLLKKVKKGWAIQAEHYSPMKDIEHMRPLDAPDGGASPAPDEKKDEKKDEAPCEKKP